MFYKKNQFIAFSLIELMIVVSIIGILAMIAVPSYDSYMTRARMSEGLVILDHMKQLVVDYYNQNAAYPSSLSDIKLNSNTYSGSANVNSVGITSGGSVMVKFNNPSGKVLALIPTVNNETTAITWSCQSKTIEQKLLPGTCSNNSNAPEF